MIIEAAGLNAAGLEAAIAAHDRILSIPASRDDKWLIAEIIRAYLAASPPSPMRISP